MPVQNDFDEKPGVEGKKPQSRKPGKMDSDPSKGGSSERGKQG